MVTENPAPSRLDNAETEAVGHIFRRIMWLLVLLSVAMSLDRTNIGFAALQMNKDLGLNGSQFGFAISIFSIGYIISEIPSNMMFAKFGARIWLPRIVFTWGLVSTAMMFAEGPRSLYALRFLLGLAEGGFLPGVILYLSYWLPEHARARGLGIFLMAQPVSFLINPILSGPLLDLNGTMGLAGWQWLFLVEGLPSVILGVVAYFLLTDKPADAAWLSQAEKTALSETLAREEARKSKPVGTVLTELRSRRMILLIISYIGLPASLISFVSWSPQIIRALAPAGSSFLYSGTISAIPALCTIIAMPLWSAHSDRTKERTWHTILPLSMAIAGWLLTIFLPKPVVSLIGLSMSLAGTFSAQGIFFALATEKISTAARPVGIATISAFGLIGAGISPPLTGFFKDLTGSYAAGSSFVVTLLVIACIGVLVASRQSPDSPVRLKVAESQGKA
jgi:ACS family 4-hydroxyphenylacetate permease-like MFS transporter